MKSRSSLHKYAIYNSPIGAIRIEHHNNRLRRVEILGRVRVDDCGLRDDFMDGVFRQIEEYLRTERKTFDIEFDLKHYTPFQKSVLEEIAQIPYGQTRSYKDIATSLGSPRASRAVGGGCNRNPLHLIIPCHRVVSSSGELVGFAAGVEIKKTLLNLEQIALRVVANEPF